METAVIYARVSSVGDRQDTARQVRDLTAYAQYKGLNVVNVFEEHISGAKKNTERAIFTDALEYCKVNNVSMLLVSELSRLGRNAWEIMETTKTFVDNGINVYLQKEQLTLLDDDGKPSIFSPIMFAVLGTCAQLERDNITYRLNSGRAKYIADGGTLGRKPGYRKPTEKKAEQYKGVIRRLKNGEKLHDIAKLENVGVSTVQRLKKEFIKG